MFTIEFIEGQPDAAPEGAERVSGEAEATRIEELKGELEQVKRNARHYERVLEKRQNFFEELKEAKARIAELEARLKEAEEKPCAEQAEHTREVLLHAVTQSKLTAAEARAEAAEKRVSEWCEAALRHYPPNWAFDATNPEMTIANIVEYRAAFGIGKKDALRAEQPAESEVSG